MAFSANDFFTRPFTLFQGGVVNGGWANGGSSSAGFGFFDDPNNVLGASISTDTPGVDLGCCSYTSGGFPNPPPLTSGPSSTP